MIIIPPAERHEFKSNLGFASSSHVWEETTSAYKRAIRGENISNREISLIAKHAGESPFAPIFVAAGGIITIILGIKTLGNALSTLTHLFTLNPACIKYLFKTVGWGMGTALAGGLTVGAGGTMAHAWNENNKK